MKIVMMILLMTLCLSCNTPYLRAQINGDISFSENRCRLRCYSVMNAWTTAQENCNRYYKKGEYPRQWAEYYTLEQRTKQDVLVFTAGNYDLKVCDKITGVFLKPFAEEIKPWAKEVIQYYEDIR